MTPTPTPSASDALQKSRELVRMSGDSSVSDEAYDEAVRLSFPFIHAELEKVTAERDAALKGYREMRLAWEEISNDKYEHDGKYYPTSMACKAKNLLTSFPEIK